MTPGRFQLPYDSPLPADPRRRRWARAARAAGYVVVLGALLTGVIQYQYRVVRNLREARAFDARYGHLSAEQLQAQGLKRPKDRAGAIARWRRAVQEFWAGTDIYRPLDPDRPDPEAPWLHPNMPFTVILLTPLTWLSKTAMAIALSAVKLAVLVAAGLAAVRVANDGRFDRELTAERRRMPDWVVLPAMLYALPAIIGDIRHGNTNTFVLGAVVLHLWLFRRGRDLWAGAALALAVCLKMTPALFGLYWLYQRNWRLLAGLAGALVLFAVVIPAAALGPAHYQTLMGSWLNHLILPGPTQGAWYPIHVNQSLPAVLGRYLLAEPNPGGNIFWNPDDNPYTMQDRFGWIAVASLSPQTVRWVIRLCQAGVLGLMAWAVGWRRLARDDGRRGLHYGLVAAGILVLNQRTWDHHACILLIGHLAVWQAALWSGAGRGARAAAIVLMALAGPLLLAPGAAELTARLAGRSGKSAELWADLAEAYGPRLAHFLAVLVAAAILSVALRKKQHPYASGGPAGKAGP